MSIDIVLNRKTRVVIVDDSRTIQAMLEMVCTNRLGCEVVGIASSAEEGLHLVRTLHPDLVTVDLFMPEIDGFELLTRLAEFRSLYKVVIAGSIDRDVTQVTRVKALGADIHFDKKLITARPELFCAKVTALLARPKQSRPDTPRAAAPSAAPPSPALLHYPVPADEAERLASVAALDLGNARPEAQFDLLTSHLGAVTGFPACFLTIIERDRQWIKSAYGYAAEHTPRSYAFCNHTICSDDMFAVANASTDARFRDNPLVVGEPAIRAYFGQAIVDAAGVKLGALSLIDVRPRQLCASHAVQLKGMAAIASAMIAARPGRVDQSRREAVLPAAAA
jgi:DNA-binding NarL/FixJ family response regulator